MSKTPRTTATAVPGGIVKIEAKYTDIPAPSDDVHLAASGFSGNATLCGYLADGYRPITQATSARVTCHACLDVVRHVRNLRVKIRERGSDGT